MAEEISNISEVKTTSDGVVKISVEKYNEMLDKIADQAKSMSKLNDRLRRALDEPPVINRTIVHKTAEMLASERRVWGGSFMGLGGAFFIVGAFLYKAGLSES